MTPSPTRSEWRVYRLFLLAVILFIAAQGWAVLRADADSIRLALLTPIVCAYVGGIIHINAKSRGGRDTSLPYSAILFIASSGLIVFALFGLLALGSKPPLAYQIAIHLGLTPAANALGFWLMFRYSNISSRWGALAVRVTTVWLLTAGMVSCLDTRAWSPLPAGIMAFYVLLAHIVLAAHYHRALSDPNHTRTLAAHWHALAVILWLGVGGSGALLTLPVVATASHDTALAALPTVCATLAASALGLALINQIMAELRDNPRRITGLLPYWCVTGGWIIALLALFASGVGAVTCAEVGVLAACGDSLPLTDFYRGGMVTALAGAVIYGIGFYVRRLRQT